MKTKLFVAIVSIVLLAAFTLPSPALDVSAGLFQSPPPAPPPNDDFADAIVIQGLPFDHSVNTVDASLESGEPTPSCMYWYSMNRTVWYAFTPAESGTFSMYVNTWFSTFRAVYTGSSLGGLSELGCDIWNGTLTLNLDAGTTYYIQVGSVYYYDDGELTFHLEQILPPPNDNFADALVIGGLPFSQGANTTAAGLESGEPTPSCAQSYPWGRSVWYAYTPTESGSVSAYSSTWFSTAVAAYTGDSWPNLAEVGSRCWGGRLTFRAEAGTTYYFQVGGMYGEGGSLTFYLEVTPPPVADFWFSPGDPSVFETVQFYNYSWDPGEVGIESSMWDFGDGTTSTDGWPIHQYSADGDYTVQLTVTTYDGRSGSTTRTLSVRTHDVAIIKFSVPKAAAVGQTRPIVVGLNSKRYPEQVQVELYKSVPGGYEWVGSLRQSVPVRPANRTTNFTFNYTFTSDDAKMGKVTFRAMASLIDAWDALPADNEAISTPTKVTR